MIKKKNASVFKRFKRLIFFGLVLGIGGGIFSVFYIFKDSLSATTGKIQASLQHASSLELRQVIVKGHVYTPLAAINQATHLTQGMGIFSSDLNQIRQEICTLPWVKDVTIQRILPDLLTIDVQEKAPLAMWQNKKKFYPLDEQGLLIQDASTFVPGILLVVGDGAPAYTPQLVQMLKNYPDLNPRVYSATWVNHRRWRLLFRTGENLTEIDLPDTNPEEALKRFSHWEDREKVLKTGVARLDLRQEGKIIIRALSGQS